MKMFATLLVLTLILGLSVACGSAKSTSAINLTAAQAKFSGYSMADFTAGQALYADNCGRCHPAYAPSSHTEEQWAKWVPKMVPKANKKAGTVAIDDAGQDLILKFLYAASH